MRTNDSGGQEERIEVPGTGLDEVKGLKAWESYKHLERDGLHLQKWNYPVSQSIDSIPSFLLARPALQIFGGKSRRIPTSTERRESSMGVRVGEHGWVDHVFVTELDSGLLVRATVRSQKIPELGDKFASRHGQKGIIGRLVDERDMPFTADGVIPDHW